MKFIFDKDTWQEIFGSIKKNKLRTAITMLGVGWGIFLFISLLGAARGMENGFDREFSNLATNSIFMWAQSTEMPYNGFQRGRRMQLNIQDVEAIQKVVPEIQFVAPRSVQGVFGGPPAQIKRKTDTKTYKLFGDYPILDNVNKVKILDGRFLNLTDIKEERKVCIIGEKVVDELFEKGERPVGDFVEINGSFFQIVGTYKDNGTSFEGDDSVYIPFSTYRKMNNTGNRIGWMVIAAEKEADILKVEKEVKSVLKRRYGVHPDDERAFGSFNFGEMFGKITGFIKGMKFLTWFVGIATLIAGVIAIGSILLITVKERTKEIGIRRAIGAKPSSIRGQIVLEAVFLTLIAGIMGIIFGGFVLMAVNAAFAGSEDGFPFVNPTVNIPIALGAVAALMTFGTLIGLVPAQRALVIRPIEALREE
jgi:putative ABC transport system permease protein